MFEKATLLQNLLLLTVLTLTVNQIKATSNKWLICYTKPDGTALSIEDVCTSYIYCKGQIPFTIPCPSGMGFSKKVGECVHFNDSDCEAATSPYMNAKYENLKTTIEATTSEAIHEICDNEKRPENQAACAGQINGSAVPYPGNCSQYLVCLCEYPVVRICRAGLWFDKRIKLCNFPRFVNCGNSVETTTISTSFETDVECLAPEGMPADVCLNNNDDFLLQYPYNCNAYVNCTMGCPILNYCQDGKVFNSFLKICDTPDTAQCEQLSLPIIEDATTTTTEAYTSTLTTTITTTENPMTATTEQPTTTKKATTTTQAASNTTEIVTSPSTCIPPLGIHISICANQAQGSILPYPFNCTAFIVCNWGCPHLEYCESGNILNIILGICDGSQEVVCKESAHPTPPTASSTLGTSKTEAISSTTTEMPFSTTLPPDVNSKLCQNQQDYAVLPYKADCSQYLQCTNGNVRLKSCPNGWLFNSQLMVCDESVAEACSNTTATLQPSLTICGNLSDGEHIEYPDNCQKYIICTQPIPVAFSCNNNWYFDEEQQTCSPDIHGLCSGLPANSTTVHPPYNICQGLNEGDWQIYPSNCKLYYLCLGHGNFMLQICTEGEYFQPQLGQCSSSVSDTYCEQNFDTTLVPPTTKPKPSGICDLQPLGAKIAHPNNCFMYIVCENPIPVGYYCPTGLQFSSDKQYCVEAIDSDCGKLPTAPTTTTTTESMPTMPYNQCTNKPDFSLLPYADDCTMFIICIRNLEHFAPCKDGQFFDALQEKCVLGAEDDSCRLEETSTTNADTKTTTEMLTTTEQTSIDTDATTTSEEQNTTRETITSTTDETTGTDTTTTTKDAITTTTASTTISTTQDPNLGPCYNKPEGTKLPYPNNCDKYIECQEPLPVAYYCPDGLEYSQLLAKCVIPKLADCSMKTTTPTTIKTT